MARRYFLVPIVGTGTFEDQFRAKIHRMRGIDYTAQIPSNEDGTPQYPFAFCAVDAEDFSVIDGDASIVEVQGADASMTVSALIGKYL